MLVRRVGAGWLGVGEGVYQTKKPTAIRLFGTPPNPSVPPSQRKKPSASSGETGQTREGLAWLPKGILFLG